MANGVSLLTVQYYKTPGGGGGGVVTRHMTGYGLNGCMSFSDIGIVDVFPKKGMFLIFIAF